MPNLVASRVLRQSVSPDSLFQVIAEWCRSGAGQRSNTLRLMSAFASGGGIGAIVPLLDVFLAEGNRLEVIVGIDLKGTDQGALRHLDALLHAYPSQCRVSVFNAPARAAIFHPKLYILETPHAVSFVIGSANLTGGGLGSNFESLILYSECDSASPIVKQALEIWSMFADPKAPLRPDFLKPLTKKYLGTLLRQLPLKRQDRERSEGATFKVLWHPLSRIPLPRSTEPKQRSRTKAPLKSLGYLVMDILTETRSTQMQVPIPIVEGFFGIDKRQLYDFYLSIVTPTGLSQPILRTLVRSQGDEGQRLMRRIEMPQIRNLTRPLGLIMIRLRGNRRFAFKLIPRSSSSYRILNRLLEQKGQQGSADRRFLLGKPGDANWRTVGNLLAQ